MLVYYKLKSIFKACLHKIFNYLLPCSSTPLAASDKRASATSLKEMWKGIGTILLYDT